MNTETSIRLGKSIIFMSQQRDVHSLFSTFIQQINQLYPEVELSIYNILETNNDNEAENEPSVSLFCPIKSRFSRVKSHAINPVIKKYFLNSKKHSTIPDDTLEFKQLSSKAFGNLILIPNGAGNAHTSFPETFTLLFQLYQNLFEMLEKSEYDKLTNLLNRQSLNSKLASLINASRQGTKRKNQLQSWLAVLDIDHFKIINDNYGHLFGDEVLLQFAQIMKKCFRFNDLLFRYGGEEFIVMVTNTNLNGALKSLERFRNLVETHTFPSDHKVTVSIGFTEITENTLPSSLIDYADKALYQSKENGRNRTTQYELDPHDNKLTETSQESVDLF